jgi:hypothetical protein
VALICQQTGRVRQQRLCAVERLDLAFLVHAQHHSALRRDRRRILPVIRKDKAMAREIPGIHHVTAICGPPQTNLDFYTGPLSQRLVKKTVNFDAPDTYHLY